MSATKTPTFRGTPMRLSACGIWTLVTRSGSAVTVYRLERLWKPWRGSATFGGRTVHERSWTAWGAARALEVAAKREALKWTRLVEDALREAMTPACDLCGRPATLTTTGPHPEDERRTLCTSCAIAVEYVHIVGGGSPLVWEYATPGSAT